MKARQLSMSPRKKFRIDHGGSIRKGKRKEARPIFSKVPIHLVLRSSRAKGKWSMRNQPGIEALVRASAKRWRVRLEAFANSGDHLHMLVRVLQKEDFQNFLRAISTMIAKRITGARK